MFLAWLLKALLVGLANIVIPLSPVAPPAPGTVLEEYSNLRKTVAVAVYVDGKEVRRLTGLVTETMLMREEVLEAGAKTQRSRVTVVELRTSARFNGQLFADPPPALLGKPFLVERTADGKLLAGHENGAPLTKPERDWIYVHAIAFGLRPSLPGPLTIGQPLTARELELLTPKIKWSKFDVVTPIGQRDVAGTQQVVFTTIGKEHVYIGDVDGMASFSGSLAVDLGGLGIESIEDSVGLIAKVRTVNHRREETRGALTMTQRVGTRRVSAPAVPAQPSR